MTFIEFKKQLLDADISLPKFSKLMKVSEKNIQAYKKKKEVPNTIEVIVTFFASMVKENIDYREIIEILDLKVKTKKGAGFSKIKKNKEKDAALENINTKEI
jgi:archaellum biogenesis protein FlaJ (TadC family)